MMVGSSHWLSSERVRFISWGVNLGEQINEKQADSKPLKNKQTKNNSFETFELTLATILHLQFTVSDMSLSLLFLSGTTAKHSHLQS